MCDGHPALYYDEYVKPGPTCNFPGATNCTNKSPLCAACEAWQTCTVLDDGSIICSPDCKLQVHCDAIGPDLKCCEGECVDQECCDDTDCPVNFQCLNGKCQGCLVDEDCDDDEYCDTGVCRIGCRDDDGCKAMSCSTCVDHVCNDPECCTDPDCKDTEFCTVDHICYPGCNEDDDCVETICSTCEISSNSCVDPECCIDTDCKAGWTCENGKCTPECLKDDDCESTEYCDTVNGICKIGCRDASSCALSCSTCVNHVCNDPECCDDDDCKNVEFCNVDNICQVGCNENSDCNETDCSSCDMSSNSCIDPECCRDDDCKAGCSTCVNHVCHDPQCCDDPDCIALDINMPVCMNEECIPGCKNDDMCPDVDNICNNSYDNCDYCNMEGSTDGIGKCDDGCASSLNCDGGQSCSSEHICITASYNSLQSIQFKTIKCEGCGSSNVEQGLMMTLTGKDDKYGPTHCETGNLDHQNKVDYKEGTTTIFEGEDDKEPLKGCYSANLQAEIHEIEVTWTGEGTWASEGAEITFAMSDALTADYVCKLKNAELSPSNPTSISEACGPASSG